MAQVTIYLDDSHEQRLRKAAAEAGVPVSRWVAALIERYTRTEWPAEVAEAAGSWPDAPDAEDLRATSAADVPRESL